MQYTMSGVRETEEETDLSNEATYGLGELQIKHPPETFAVTPASLASLCAIGTHQQLLSGNGLDWGAGVGTLSIAATRIEAVNKVYGLEIVPANIEVACENARSNGVADKTKFFLSDSFSPFDKAEGETVTVLKGKVQFILANPPSSEGDDGFDFRRRILRESQDFLVDGGVVFLSISSQYGRRRIANLTSDAAGFTHTGVLATTDWVSFDLTRPDLLDCLRTYVQEERRSGSEYEFALPGEKTDELVNAQTAMTFSERTGQSPLSMWQTHLFEYDNKS
jgi:hypothetical protein